MRLVMTTVLALSMFTAAWAAEQGARSMSGQFSITSAEGWPGKRYIDGGVVFAEEFDVNNDGQVDLWRFYRRGLLSSEEQDLNYDGRVDLVTRWDPRDARVQRMIGLARDSRHRGSNDLEMDFEGRRWTISVDRNGDGIADRILIAEGPRDLFEQLGLNLELHPDIIDQIPVEYWIEYHSDDAGLGYITDYRRYARGRQNQWGEWNGRKVVWYKMNDRRQPPQVAAAPQPAAPAATTTAQAPEWPDDQQTTYVAPQDPAISSSDTYSDPYGTVTGTDPYAGQAGGGVFYYGDETFIDTTPPPAFSDRTRYEGLPPGESVARSLPARMRPPGVGRNR